MHMKEKILDVVKGEDEVTSAFIAHKLKVDVPTVETCLSCMEKTGELQRVTWEKLLRTGK